MSDQGLFYGSTAICLGVTVSVGVLVLLLRITFDKSFGWRRMFTMKRTLAVGLLALGTSYLLSGIGHEQYLEYAKGNLLFALIQFASLFLLYFIFSCTVKWEKFDLDYFAWTGLIIGLVVAAEVCIIYIVNDVFVGGSILRERIYSGWGCYNNIGAMISLSIPFAFYFACTKKRSSLFFAVACLLLIAVFFSASRGSTLGAVIIFLISLGYTFFKCKNKKEFRISLLILVGIIAVCELVFHEQLSHAFEMIPGLSHVDNDQVVLDDSGRIEIYKNGIKIFLRHPIFGQSFYPIEYDLYSFSQLQQFKSFFPPRWHNTVVQMLTSCGLVGMIAYSYHRIDTIRLFWKKRTTINTFIFFYMITLLIMSLLDCHFFNVGPVLFYSTALAVAEFGQENAKKRLSK